VRPRIPLLAIAFLLTSVASAAELLVFEDGRTLRVSKAETIDGNVHVELEGGGGMVLPASAVSAVEEATEISEVEAAEIEAVVTDVEEMQANEGWRARAGLFADRIQTAADHNGLDPALLTAVARWESNFNPYAVSVRGACGIVQLMPKTAERFGVSKIFDASENLEGGARYLRFLLDRFHGSVDLTLAAYNAGEGSVDRHRGIPPYRETRAYVVGVMRELATTTPTP
jgi:soluble lytic murein transglycosylase-like protein